MDDFLPATVVGYSEWPKNTPNYWALPAMGDVVGWTYRKDWFSRPELQKEFKAKYGWDLGPPTTYDQLKQIAEFFQGREIDGKKVYGASIYTERGSEGITMGVTNVLYDCGFEYQNPKKPYDMEGFVNSPDAVKGLEFYKDALQVLHAAGRLQRLHGRIGRRLQIRPGRAAHELRLHLARPLQGPECRRRQDRLLRQSGGEGALRPARRPGHLGGLLFRQPGRRASSTSSGSCKPDVQKKWWALGGYSCAKSVLDDPGFVNSAPYAKTFLDSMAIVKDFWAEPSYAELLLRPCRSASTTTSSPTRARRKEALDALVKDWTEGLPGRRQDLVIVTRRRRDIGLPRWQPRRGSRSLDCTPA